MTPAVAPNGAAAIFLRQAGNCRLAALLKLAIF